MISQLDCTGQPKRAVYTSHLFTPAETTVATIYTRAFVMQKLPFHFCKIPKLLLNYTLLLEHMESLWSGNYGVLAPRVQWLHQQFLASLISEIQDKTNSSYILAWLTIGSSQRHFAKEGKRAIHTLLLILTSTCPLTMSKSASGIMGLQK